MSTSSGSKKRSSPGTDSDPNDNYVDKRKKLRLEMDTTMALIGTTSRNTIGADPPSTVRSRLDRRQSLFGLNSPRFQGSNRPIPIIIPDTPAPAPRKGKAKAPAVLMTSPTPI